MDSESDPRQAAIKRLEAKRGFTIHFAVYVIVNALLIVIWAVTARGYFWPIWPVAGWGIGVAIHGWITYFQKPISEDEIRREMERGGYSLWSPRQEPSGSAQHREVASISSLTERCNACVHAFVRSARWLAPPDARHATFLADGERTA